MSENGKIHNSKFAVQKSEFPSIGWFDFVVEAGQIDTENLTIGNSGLGNLDYEISYPVVSQWDILDSFESGDMSGWDRYIRDGGSLNNPVAVNVENPKWGSWL